MNQTILIGRWSKDCELTFLPGNGTAVLRGTLAVDRKIKKEGQPSADFISVVIWGKQAESTAQYAGGKGTLIGIVGRIVCGSYEAKDGTKRYTTEVHASEVQFLEKKNSGGAAPSSGNDITFGADMTPVDDGDIPF